MLALPAGVQIHHAGDHSVDGVLRLIGLASDPAPLEVALTAMCREIAAIAGADVVSAYVREPDDGGDRLVMRGNHGFPAGTIGAVRLGFGEGLTGLCAECLRPVSVAVGSADSHFKLVPGLGEERFPAYLGVPLTTSGRALGVLVLQRRAPEAFTAAEVTLALALAAPMMLAVERRLGAAALARSVRLDGATVAPGNAVGRVAMLPTLASLGDRGSLDVVGALARLPAELDRAMRRLRKHGAADVRAAVHEVELLLLDGRLRERVAAAPPTVDGLATVARDYARAPFKLAAAGRAATMARAAEVEDLLVLVATMAGDAAVLPPGGIWIGERLSGLIALVACARAAGAVVVEGEASPAAAAIARADELTAVAAVRGLHAWVRPGDRATVDAPGDGPAAVRVNPAAVAVEHSRRRRDTASDTGR